MLFLLMKFIIVLCKDRFEYFGRCLFDYLVKHVYFAPKYGKMHCFYVFPNNPPNWWHFEAK